MRLCTVGPFDIACDYAHTAFRKVVKETDTGSTLAKKKTLKLTINVESVDFDASAASIRVKGRNVSDSEFVKVVFFRFRCVFSCLILAIAGAIPHA